MTITDRPLRVGVVGPCTAGKSTLVARLKNEGIEGRHIAQEHSYVQYMWQRITNPDVLVFLDVSFEGSLRRHRLNWSMEDYLEQHRRLQHARDHCDLYIHTDALDPDQVLQRVLDFLAERAGNDG